VGCEVPCTRQHRVGVRVVLVAKRVLPPSCLSTYPYQVDRLGLAITETGQTIRYALLHAAATNGQLYMAYELLKRGANANIVGSRGETACGQSACLDRHSSWVA